MEDSVSKAEFRTRFSSILDSPERFLQTLKSYHETKDSLNCRSLLFEFHAFQVARKDAHSDIVRVLFDGGLLDILLDVALQDDIWVSHSEDDYEVILLYNSVYVFLLNLL